MISIHVFEGWMSVIFVMSLSHVLEEICIIYSFIAFYLNDDVCMAPSNVIYSLLVALWKHSTLLTKKEYILSDREREFSQYCNGRMKPSWCDIDSFPSLPIPFYSPLLSWNTKHHSFNPCLFALCGISGLRFIIYTCPFPQFPRYLRPWKLMNTCRVQ